MKERSAFPSITHLSPLPPPVGGVSIFVDRLHRRLRSSGINSRVAVPRAWTGSQQGGAIRRPGFPGVLWHLDALLYLSKPFSTDIVHSHEGYRENAPILLALKARAKKIVLTIHSSRHCGDLDGLHPWQRICAQQIVADPRTSWVAVNEQIRERLIRLGVAGSLVVIPAYMPPNPSSIDLPDHLLSFIKTHTPLLLVYGFRFSRFDGKDLYGFESSIRMLHQLMPHYSQIGLVVLCPDSGSDSGKERLAELRGLSYELGTADSIYWVLHPFDALQSLLQQCTLYIRPTLSDGDSLLVREALAKSVRVVASDVVPRPKGVETYPIRESVDGLARAVTKALCMGKSMVFDQPDTFTSMLKIYERVFDDPKQRDKMNPS